MASVAELQFEILRQQYPGSRLERLSDGTLLVSVPEVRLPSGWNQDSTTILFLVPVGYPAARPDCFRSEEHTSELQSPVHLVCRLLLEKQKIITESYSPDHP